MCFVARLLFSSLTGIDCLVTSPLPASQSVLPSSLPSSNDSFSWLTPQAYKNPFYLNVYWPQSCCPVNYVTAGNLKAINQASDLRSCLLMIRIWAFIDGGCTRCLHGSDNSYPFHGFFYCHPIEPLIFFLSFDFFLISFACLCCGCNFITCRDLPFNREEKETVKLNILGNLNS